MATQTPPSGAPDQTSLREAVGQAREEINKETATDSTPAGDGGAETTTPPTPTTAAEAQEFLENATAEEIEAIRADPRLNKVYNSLIRGFKEKTTEVAGQRKKLEDERAEFEQSRTDHNRAVQLFDMLRDDPEGTIRAMAQRQGLTIQEAKQAVAAVETDAELVKLFGDDAEKIAPVLNSYIDKRSDARTREALKTVVGIVEQIQEKEMQREVDTDLRQFASELKAAGEEMTPEIEKEMNRLMKQIDPATDPETGKQITAVQFLHYLYRIASAGQSRAKVAKEVVTRMAKAVKETVPAEIPSTSAIPASSITPEMNLRQSISAARRDIKAGR